MFDFLSVCFPCLSGRPRVSAMSAMDSINGRLEILEGELERAEKMARAEAKKPVTANTNKRLQYYDEIIKDHKIARDRLHAIKRKLLRQQLVKDVNESNKIARYALASGLDTDQFDSDHEGMDEVGDELSITMDKIGDSNLDTADFDQEHYSDLRRQFLGETELATTTTTTTPPQTSRTKKPTKTALSASKGSSRHTEELVEEEEEDSHDEKDSLLQ